MNLKQAKERYKRQLLELPNVVGVGVGRRITGGEATGEDAIVVMVVKKKSLGELRPEEIVPRKLESWRTDVVETGEIWALKLPTDRWRPAKPGVSIGHYNVSAGTFGAVVQHDDGLMVLSNNHVLGDTNNAVPGDAELQPGKADGGTLPDDFLEPFVALVPITMSPSPCPIIGKVVDAFNTLACKLGRTTRIRAFVPEPFAANEVDCAMAGPCGDEVVPEILNIGRPQKQTIKPAVGMEVQKSGRTTGYTKDSITAIDVTVTVNYLVGMATFEHQIMAGPMSAGGDSGSLVLDMQKHPVGLLFAGSDQVTIINEIDRVLGALDIEFI